MNADKIFNIRSEYSFVDELAAIFSQKYASNPDKLADVLFLLPTNRACQSLADAFLRYRGLEPSILPQILPISNVEEDEVFLTGRSEILPKLAPEISATERALIFTRLIMHKPSELGLKHISLSQAYSLAQNLGGLMDQAYNEKLTFDRLKDIVPEEYATHWQETLKLLEIITHFWPEIKKERGVVDTIERRNFLLEEEIRVWQKTFPHQKIVIAGTTAPFPRLKELVKTVLQMPEGEVYLYGLDKYLDDSSWEKIDTGKDGAQIEDKDENHPQFELKKLLDYLQMSRSTIKNLPTEGFSERERFVSELMRPAQTSAEWRKISQNHFSKEAYAGLQLINCDDIRQEAQAIALVIRQTLETPEKTAALVTSDRNLSRRVVAELSKWNIVADDSAGQPLSLTPIGVYLRLILEVVIKGFSQVSLLSLMKHPFTSAGYNRTEFNKLVHKIEHQWRKQYKLDDDQERFLQNIRARMQSLVDLYNQPQVDIRDIFISHIKTAESLADTDIKSGEKIIWKRDDGACASKFISDFLAKCVVLETIPTTDYAGFINTLLVEQNVRVRYGMHPRVKILGPIEARLSQYDVTIIGEVNEGVWPKMPAADMWMSRPMKHDFGFPQPERSIGVMAADFAHLLCGKQVYLTRAGRIDGDPTTKSRWWLRLETVMAADLGTESQDTDFIYDKKYSLWAKRLERAPVMRRIFAPEPRPEVYMRPRSLSASEVRVLKNNAYDIFAKRILELKPLQELDVNLQRKDYGNIIHKVLERFNNKYPHDFPPNAEAELIELGREEFANNNVSSDVEAFWWPQFLSTVSWIIAKEKQYRPDISLVHNEITGQITLKAPAGDIIISARADRIDETKTGKLNIIDYKTGQAPSASSVVGQTEPQLLIEGLIAASGGYEGIKPKPISTVRYWKLGKDDITVDNEEKNIISDEFKQKLQNLVSQFDDKNTPYCTSSKGIHSDYEHLSRYLEWAVKDDN